ncbi:unnamed protein product [Mucor hiemalis]
MRNLQNLGKLITGGGAKSLASYNALYYRSNKKTAAASNINTAPVIVYVDSMEEIEALSQLLCRLEHKEDVHLHIVIDTWNPRIHAIHMFGVSLYAPKLTEADPSGRHWFSPSIILKNAGYPGKIHEPPYIMQWPSHSGAVFFPEHWREFHDYITARVTDSNGFSMQDVAVPELR